MKHDDTLIVESAPHRVGLRVEVRGVANYENTLAYWQAMSAELLAHPVPGLLLIDKTSGKPLLAEEWKALVEAMAGKGLEQVRLAHVKPSGLQRIEFCQLYAIEAGIDARVFTDEGEADLWLRYGERAPLTGVITGKLR